MATVIAVWAALSGCWLLRSEPEIPPEGTTDEVEVEVELPPEKPQVGYLVGTTSLRKITSDERKMEDPATGKQVSNWVATLYRGEEVAIIGEDGEWSQLRVSDGSEGWLKTNRLVSGPDTRVGTLFDVGKTFKRPDLLALDGDRTIEPGSLIFVLQEKDQFSEIDYPRSSSSSATTWALSSELVFEPHEVDAAKLIMKVQQLRANKDDNATGLEELARSQFGSSRLISLLDVPEPEPEALPEELPPSDH